MVERRREQIEARIERYLTALASADRQASSDFMTAKVQRLQEKVALLKERLEKLKTLETQ